MARYHINPETGNPNVCTAKVKCKFTSEDGVVPPHYETQSEAKKAAEAKAKKTSQAKPKAQAKIPNKKQSEKPAVVKAETGSGKSATLAAMMNERNETKLVAPPVEAPIAALPEAKTLENVVPTDDDELRGPESLERAIKIARKLSISAIKRKKILLVSLKKFQKNAPSRLRSIRSKITKRS